MNNHLPVHKVIRLHSLPFYNPTIMVPGEYQDWNFPSCKKMKDCKQPKINVHKHLNVSHVIHE